MRSRGGRWVVAGVVFAACARPVEPPAAEAALPGVVRPPVVAVERPARVDPDPPPAPARRLAAANRLALAEELLCSYQDASKYPFTSRPIAEHPDQVRPNRPVVELRAMQARDGSRDAKIRVRTGQSRVFMAAAESVVFDIAATDADGQRLALQVERAVARGLPGERELVAPQVVLVMDGAGVGQASGVLSPAATEFAGFAGTIRTEIEYRVAGRTGVAWLDVFYSPEVPATWSGQIQETVEDGSLVFAMTAQVAAPGRYLVSARVDDARGEPFALLTFNDLLGAGEQVVRLRLHGRLIHDLAPTFPLRLRDIDAFLLREDTDPDRALMPRIAGEAHVTRMHGLAEFSDAEWQSEERTRYLTEMSRDVEQARAELAELDPGRPGVAFTPDQCRGFNASVGAPQS
jgi:hypothetical protein